MNSNTSNTMSTLDEIGDVLDLAGEVASIFLPEKKVEHEDCDDKDDNERSRDKR